MDSFTYVNIFETKGLEYLLLLSFWVLFVFLVRYRGFFINDEDPAFSGWAKNP